MKVSIKDLVSSDTYGLLGFVAKKWSKEIGHGVNEDIVARSLLSKAARDETYEFVELVNGRWIEKKKPKEQTVEEKPVAQPTSKERPDWDEYFMGFARSAASRATCDRKHVGAVIVSNRQVVSTGYNGSVAGMPHCNHWVSEKNEVPLPPGEVEIIRTERDVGVGHDMRNGSCIRTIHAEMNALTQAAKRGVSTDGAAIYSTASPCWACFRVLVNAGIKEFYFDSPYASGGNDELPRVMEVADTLNLTVRHIRKNG